MLKKLETTSTDREYKNKLAKELSSLRDERDFILSDKVYADKKRLKQIEDRITQIGQSLTPFKKGAEIIKFGKR